MTFRAKPVASKPRRHSRDSYSRRNTYLNIGFGIAVVVAVLILVGVAGVTYYDDHLAPAATVGGQTITKDEFNERPDRGLAALQQQARINADVAAGRLTSAQGQRRPRRSAPARAAAFVSTVLEKLIDG